MFGSILATETLTEIVVKFVKDSLKNLSVVEENDSPN